MFVFKDDLRKKNEVDVELFGSRKRLCDLKIFEIKFVYGVMGMID